MKTKCPCCNHEFTIIMSEVDAKARAEKYDAEKKKRTDIIANRKARLRNVLEERRSGKTYRAIAEELGLSKSRVASMFMQAEQLECRGWLPTTEKKGD